MLQKEMESFVEMFAIFPIFFFKTFLTQAAIEFDPRRKKLCNSLPDHSSSFPTFSTKLAVFPLIFQLYLFNYTKVFSCDAVAFPGFWPTFEHELNIAALEMDYDI